MTPWVKKYQPTALNEIVGQPSATNQIRSILSSKKPTILYGPTGSGKTTTIYALGKEYKLEVFEINASDRRNKKSINEQLSNALMQQSLFSKGKIILIDDIDALSGRKDRGAIPSILSLLEKTPFPIVFTCIDPWKDKLSKLRRRCTMIEYTHLKREDIVNHLKTISQKENLQYTDNNLDLLAKICQGDMRAAINDLQTQTHTGFLEIEDQGERDKEKEITECLRKILKSKKWEETYNIFYKTNLNTDECFLWLDENIPKEYKGQSLIKAYDHLSKADVFKGRIRRWQHWRFLVYINAHLTGGIASAKKEAYTGIHKYTRTTRLLKLWQAKIRNAKKLSICEKIASKTHTSRKRALQDTFPFLKKVLLDNKIGNELELNDDEIAWLKKI